MTNDWYVRFGGAERGPMSSEALKHLALEGSVRPETSIKKGAAGNWVPASHVKGLFPPAANQTAPRIVRSAPHAEPAPRVPAVLPQVAVPQSASRGLGRFAVAVIRRADRVLLTMAGGEENMILYRFLQVVVLSIPVWAVVIAMVISSSKHQAEQSRIEAANEEVRQAVEKAEKWIQAGPLADADQIESGLTAADADSVATEKTSVGPTLSAFRNAKDERQAARILESALKAIAEKQFEKAQKSLREYLEHPYAADRQRAQSLISEVTLATSDEDALRTLLAMDDKAFTAFSNGGVVVDVPSISDPVLADTRVGTLKKNVAEAGRQREERRKKAEAERLAEQKRLDAEKQAIQRSKELAAEATRKEKEAAERQEQMATKAKQDEEDKKRQLAEACPLSIEGLRFDKDDIGTPHIGLTVKNRKSQPIEAFEVVVACYDKFGDPVNGFGFGDNKKTLIYQETIRAGATIRPNGSWALYGHDTARRFRVTVVRVKMADGTEWNPPEGFENVNSGTFEVHQ